MIQANIINKKKVLDISFSLMKERPKSVVGLPLHTRDCQSSFILPNPLLSPSKDKTRED